MDKQAFPLTKKPRGIPGLFFAGGVFFCKVCIFKEMHAF